MRRFTKLLLLVGAASCSFNTLAATLTVDFAVFRQPSWVRDRDNGVWPYAPVDLQQAVDPSQALREGQLKWFTGASSGFASAADKMQSSGYEVLYLASFEFTQTRARDAQTWRLEQGTPLSIAAIDPYDSEGTASGAWFDQATPRIPETVTPLSGWLRSWVDTYLFVEFDLAWLDRAAFGQITPGYEQPLGSGWQQPISNQGFSMEEIWPRDAVVQYRLSERKRVKLNEIHYFDHPMIGVLARVRELDESADTPETTAE